MPNTKSSKCWCFSQTYIPALNNGLVRSLCVYRSLWCFYMRGFFSELFEFKLMFLFESTHKDCLEFFCKISKKSRHVVLYHFYISFSIDNCSDWTCSTHNLLWRKIKLFCWLYLCNQICFQQSQETRLGAGDYTLQNCRY